MSAIQWESEDMNLPLSVHARKRSQQRCIGPLAIDLLLRFGQCERTRDGWTHFADKAARRRIERHLGGPRALSVLGPQLDAYIITGDDGRILTVASRRRKRCG
ncbi:hypothetical protein [Roseomonas gilardii]|uniref:hypothetical protein n=1 Tax=Roseomonas gilardii TaxID=257708 RepID=UPI001C92C149|nr:hypothetical protein [Roseomonas gilardii]